MSSTIFKRKSNVKQILVELSKLYPWLCLSLFEFWAYFVVFLFSVQLKKITFLVWESQSVLSIFQASFQARVGKADRAITQLARSALPTLAWKLACKTADFLWLIRKCTKKTQAILREINELLRSMKQFFLDSHVHFSLLNYIQNFSMSRK